MMDSKKLLTHLTLGIGIAVSLCACQKDNKDDMFATRQSSTVGYYNSPAPRDVEVNDTFRSANSKPVNYWHARQKQPHLRTHGKLG